MTALLDGKTIAAGIRAEVAELTRDKQVTLAIVVATDDDGTAWYVRSLTKAAEKVGITARIVDLGSDARQDELAGALTELASDDSVHGIILQTPLPTGVQADALTELIPVHKDVDGASPVSAGRLVAGLPAYAPATAAAVLEILDAYDVPLEGARAVVIGRSMVVGKPALHLLLARNATVTVCHSRTKDLAAVAREADVLVAAIGRPRFVTKDFVREGATVIDVGTTADETGAITGDVADVDGVAGAVTPVPGGVGPVTTALLLRNTAHAASTSGGGSSPRA